MLLAARICTMPYLNRDCQVSNQEALFATAAKAKIDEDALAAKVETGVEAARQRTLDVLAASLVDLYIQHIIWFDQVRTELLQLRQAASLASREAKGLEAEATAYEK